MYDEQSTHDGIIYTIVARNGWKEFRSFIKALKIKVKEYKTKHRMTGMDFPLFCEYVKPICEESEDDIEQKELWVWCMGHKIV